MAPILWLSFSRISFVSVHMWGHGCVVDSISTTMTLRNSMARRNINNIQKSNSDCVFCRSSLFLITSIVVTHCILVYRHPGLILQMGEVVVERNNMSDFGLGAYLSRTFFFGNGLFHCVKLVCWVVDRSCPSLTGTFILVNWYVRWIKVALLFRLAWWFCGVVSIYDALHDDIRFCLTRLVRTSILPFEKSAKRDYTGGTMINNSEESKCAYRVQFSLNYGKDHFFWVC